MPPKSPDNEQPSITMVDEYDEQLRKNTADHLTAATEVLTGQKDVVPVSDLKQFEVVAHQPTDNPDQPSMLPEVQKSTPPLDFQKTLIGGEIADAIAGLNSSEELANVDRRGYVGTGDIPYQELISRLNKKAGKNGSVNIKTQPSMLPNKE